MSEDKFVYLTVEDVEDLHDQALKRDGGRAGREPGRLESILALPESGFSEYERYPTLAQKAAVYHYYIASGHCFEDGNKRTAYFSTVTFLDYNGYDLIATSEDVYNWTLMIADHNKRPEFKRSVKWIEERMRPFD